MNAKKPIVILGPMESESAWLIRQLEQPREQIVGAYTFYEGKTDGRQVVICRTYIGVVNSAVAAALAIQQYDPLCVIIQGTAGAHDPDLHQGDIVLGERIVSLGSYYTPHRDAGQGASALDWIHTGDELPQNGMAERVTVYHSDERILAVAEALPYHGGKLVRGTIGAADVWNRELDMIAHLHQTLGSDCEEMEGFGVIQVCAQFGVPCADIRIISNSEWHPQEEFNEKFGEDCQMFVLEVIRSLIAKKTLL